MNDPKKKIVKYAAFVFEDGTPELFRDEDDRQIWGDTMEECQAKLSQVGGRYFYSRIFIGEVSIAHKARFVVTNNVIAESLDPE